MCNRFFGFNFFKDCRAEPYVIVEIEILKCFKEVRFKEGLMLVLDSLVSVILWEVLRPSGKSVSVSLLAFLVGS